jgi:RNA polymerase primary sigma factor
VEQLRKVQTESAIPDSLGIYLREIRRIPLLTPKQEQELAKRAQSGEQQALDELVRRNLRFVVSVAKQYMGSGVPFEDLINEGNVGLIRAAKRYDVDRGYRFISYAVWWVKQAILQYLGEQSRTVRLPLNKTTALTRITRESQRLGQELGREPTPDELAVRLELTPGEVERVLNMPVKQFSIDDPIEGQDNDFYVETLRDDDSHTPEETLVETSRTEDIEAALSSPESARGRHHSPLLRLGRPAAAHAGRNRRPLSSDARTRAADPRPRHLAPAQLAADGAAAGLLHELKFVADTSGTLSPR